jgi:hypothetical protein
VSLPSISAAPNIVGAADVGFNNSKYIQSYNSISI